MMRLRSRSVLLTAVLALLATAVQAQEPKYPSKPVRLLVPFSAGSPTDVVARVYAERLSQRFGRPLIVENRPGSGGVIASQAVLNAAPDGHTLLFPSSAHAVNPALYDKLPYDTLRDFAGVALVATSPSVVVVNPDLGVRTLKDFIELAKRQPGKLNFGSAGAGSAIHLAGEYLLSQAQISLVHVPYKGGQEAVTEVVAGRVQAAFPPIVVALPQIRAGRVVALAVTSTERAALLPEVPTVREAGLAGFEYGIWFALVAPAKVPRPILEQLANEVRAINQVKEMREKLASLGLIPLNLTLRDFDAYIKSEMDTMGRLVKASGAKPN